MGSDFLFVPPSFSRGAARALDIGATLTRVSYNVSRTPKEADFRALWSDWAMIGQDLWAAAPSAVEQNGSEEK